MCGGKKQAKEPEEKLDTGRPHNVQLTRGDLADVSRPIITVFRLRSLSFPRIWSTDLLKKDGARTSSFASSSSLLLLA